MKGEKMNLRNCTLLMALLLDIILATKASASPWDYQKYIINGNIEKIAEGVRKYPSSLNPESETSFLKMACDADNLASVRYLVDHGAKLNSNGPHMSVLALAAARGHLDIVKFLVSRGAQVNAVSHQITPLMSAATFSNVDVVKFLLSKGANANAVIRIKEKYGFHFQIGFTALHFLTVSKPAFF
jgi:ankyrin repeat protein